MNKQQGALKLKGTHGDFTFARTKDGFVWKQKSKVDKNQFLNDPKFDKLRQNAAEFSSAGKAVKLLRRIFTPQVEAAKDRRLTSRMQTLMMAVTKGDTTFGRGRGERIPADGPLELFQGFELNKEASLLAILKLEVNTDFDRATGEATIQLPGFNPKQGLVHPESATHYRISLGAASVDFRAEDFVANFTETALMPISNEVTTPLELSVPIDPNSTMPVFIVAGIRYSEMVNGVEYADKAGGSNAASFVKVDNP